jgi:hypothetical protein
MHAFDGSTGADSDSWHWSVLLGCILGMRPLLDLGRTQGQRAACVGHPVLNSHCGRGMARARHGTGPTWHWPGMARHGNKLEWHWHGTGMALARAAWHWHGMALARHGTGPAWHWPGMALARPGTGLAWHGTGPAWHWPGMALAWHGMQSAARASVLPVVHYCAQPKWQFSQQSKAQLWSHRYSTAEYQASTHQEYSEHSMH